MLALLVCSDQLQLVSKHVNVTVIAIPWYLTSSVCTCHSAQSRSSTLVSLLHAATAHVVIELSKACSGRQRGLLVLFVVSTTIKFANNRICKCRSVDSGLVSLYTAVITTDSGS